MTPFLLAAIGGLFTELAGVLNIALEGLMLTGAFFSVVFASVTGNLFWGIVLGSALAMLLAFVFGVISIYLKTNIFIAGLATNLLASSFTMVLSYRLFQTKGVIRFQELPHLPFMSVAFLERIPLIGAVLNGHNFLVYVSWVVVIMAAFIIFRTPFGMRIRASGRNPEALVAVGLRPERYQITAIVISGFTCGISGSFLALHMGAFVPNITAGRGWIALVAIYLGQKNPLGVLIACFIFGLAESISNRAQGMVSIPTDFILAFPYLLTVAAMIFYSIWRHYKKRI